MVATALTREQEQREERGLLRFSTAGSVDDGKSTLVGRLLHDSKNLLDDQAEALKKASEKHAGKGPVLGRAEIALCAGERREQTVCQVTVAVENAVAFEQLAVRHPPAGAGQLQAPVEHLDSGNLQELRL